MEASRATSFTAKGRHATSPHTLQFPPGRSLNASIAWSSS